MPFALLVLAAGHTMPVTLYGTADEPEQVRVTFITIRGRADDFGQRRDDLARQTNDNFLRYHSVRIALVLLELDHATERVDQLAGKPVPPTDAGLGEAVARLQKAWRELLKYRDAVNKHPVLMEKAREKVAEIQQKAGLRPVESK